MLSEYYRNCIIGGRVFIAAVLPSWVDHRLYNEFPGVQDARSSVEEACQIAVAKVFADSIPELIGKIGVIITHRHYSNKQNENVVGHLDGHTLYSKPQHRTADVCPTMWVAIKNKLLATEGIDNPSLEVRQLAARVDECASRILPFLAMEPNEKFSKLGIAIDPRIISNTDATYFLERNDNERSILNPQKEQSEESTILTYVAVELSQTDKDGPTKIGSDILPRLKPRDSEG